MNPRALISYLIGYKVLNIWKLWLLIKQKIICARNIIFNETLQYDPEDPFLKEIIIPEQVAKLLILTNQELRIIEIKLSSKDEVLEIRLYKVTESYSKLTNKKLLLKVIINN